MKLCKSTCLMTPASAIFCSCTKSEQRGREGASESGTHRGTGALGLLEQGGLAPTLLVIAHVLVLVLVLVVFATASLPLRVRVEVDVAVAVSRGSRAREGRGGAAALCAGDLALVVADAVLGEAVLGHGSVYAAPSLT